MFHPNTTQARFGHKRYVYHQNPSIIGPLGRGRVPENKTIGLVIVIIVLSVTLSGCTTTPGVDEPGFPMALDVVDIVFSTSYWYKYGIDTPDDGNMFMFLKVRATSTDSGPLESITAVEFSVVIDQVSVDPMWLDTIDYDNRFVGDDFGEPSSTILPQDFIEGWLIFEVKDDAVNSTQAELIYEKLFMGDAGVTSTTFSPAVQGRTSETQPRLELTLNDIFYVNRVEWSVPDPEERFLVIDVTVRNLGLALVFILRSDFLIIDSSGRTHVNDFQTLNLKERLVDSSLPFNASVSGQVLFSIPQDALPDKIVLDDFDVLLKMDIDPGTIRDVVVESPVAVAIDGMMYTSSLGSKTPEEGMRFFVVTFTVINNMDESTSIPPSNIMVVDTVDDVHQSHNSSSELETEYVGGEIPPGQQRSGALSFMMSEAIDPSFMVVREFLNSVIFDIDPLEIETV
jgi:hypothetical protein